VRELALYCPLGRFVPPERKSLARFNRIKREKD
jgi:hypothetical protein